MRRILSCLLLAAALVPCAIGQNELKFYLRSEPKTLNPPMVADDASETIRYLTGGVLLRLNRQTQRLEPELASAWLITHGGRTITFTLRPAVYYSDGTPFGAQDVKYTMEQLMDPALHSPTGDAFRSGDGKMVATVLSPQKIAITFPQPVAGLDRLFDQVAIVSSQSPNVRVAISFAINRDDLCRVVYHGHASPAFGPVSSANKFWFNAHMQPLRFDQQAALQLLRQDGFQFLAGQLRDREGHPVEFSIMTSAGSRARERMATMIQQDLRAIGITVNVTTLDFASLIQRISEDFNYEAALLGLVNVELDPNSQMNVWLSSSEEHQWNPKQKTPATPWEAEIDRLMRAQASALDDRTRKRSFDRVQEIVAEQAPFIYLVNKNSLVAVSTLLQGAQPVAVRPQTYWNIEQLSLALESASNAK